VELKQQLKWVIGSQRAYRSSAVATLEKLK